MKLISLFSICFLFISYSYAQEKQDTIKTITKDDQQVPFLLKSKESVTDKDSSQTPDGKQFILIGAKKYINGSAKRKDNHSNQFKAHCASVFYGFVNFVDLPQSHEYLKLDMKNSFVRRFTIPIHSIEFRHNFGMFIGLGYEYQRLKFSDDNTSIVKAGGGIIPINLVEADPNMTSIRRSVLKTKYITVPLLMEIQFPASNKPSERLYMSGGVIGGVRVWSGTQIVYDHNGDRQIKETRSNFNIVPVKADLTARIGFKHLFAWGSYSLTNLFSADNMPDLHLYTIGIGVAL